MKLDATVMRTMSRTDFRVLAAVETGMSDHALVPIARITSIARLRHGGCHKILSGLLRDKLLSHDRSHGYDGYRLTNCGYDILALHRLKSRKIIVALGDRVGTGKESDVYLAVNGDGTHVVLKFHRLGRTSFRNVRKKRDYFMHNANRDLPHSWLFLSRISALKEYAFMKALHDAGSYRVPTPIAHDRHVVAMSLVRGVPLYQLRTERVNASQAASVFEQSVETAVRLARHGLVHCDLNEFNLLVDMSGGTQTDSSGNNDHDDAGTHYVRHSGLEVDIPGSLSAHLHRAVDGTGEIVTEAPPAPKELLEDGVTPRPIVTLIDFPQMVSTRHPNANELFDRDVACLRRYFEHKLKCAPDEDEGGWGALVPRWEDLVKTTTSNKNDHRGEKKEQKNTERVDADSDDDGEMLASRFQVRLDEELKASGYSEADRKRDMELHYFANERQYVDAQEEEEEEDSNEEEDTDDDANANENHHPSVAQTPEKTSSETVHPVVEEDEEDKDGSDEDDEIECQRRWERAERTARERVRRHLEQNKLQAKKKGAFRAKNSNKTFVKGRRVANDCLF